MREKRLFGGSTRIPKYKGPKWSASIDNLEPDKIPQNLDKLPVYRFYQAARVHRAHVLSNLLAYSGDSGQRFRSIRTEVGAQRRWPNLHFKKSCLCQSFEPSCQAFDRQ